LSDAASSGQQIEPRRALIHEKKTSGKPLSFEREKRREKVPCLLWTLYGNEITAPGKSKENFSNEMIFGDRKAN
jgi:hypothetical protein